MIAAEIWALQSLILKKSTSRRLLEPKEFRQKLATTYIDLIENALSASHVAPIAFTPIFIFEDLELIPQPLKDWLANDFNQALRKSKFFENTRFLLSSEKSMAHFEAFFCELWLFQAPRNHALPFE